MSVNPKDTLKTMYLKKDVQLKDKNGDVYFSAFMGDSVEITYDSENIMIALNRDGEKGFVRTGDLSPRFVSKTPLPNGPLNKPEREEIEVKLPIQRPVHLGRTTTPVKKPVSKVKHLTKASTLF